MSPNPLLSICTTNYNCANVLPRHLASVYRTLEGIGFEYIVVDNRSKDGSLPILSDWAMQQPNMSVSSRRCTMGEGRQIAFSHSRGQFIMVLDTDVIYSSRLRVFLERYLQRHSDVSVQALYCGIFPRDHWTRVGGRRSLNTNEDVDMWIRLLRLGKMKWYPLSMGENLKEPSALGSSDYLSQRYPPSERVFRLLRREWDLLKTRPLRGVDLGAAIRANTIDFGLEATVGAWPQARVRQSTFGHWASFVRDLRAAISHV